MSKKGKPPPFPSESAPPLTPTGSFLPAIATSTKKGSVKRMEQSYVPSSPSLPYLRTAQILQLQNLSGLEISESSDVIKPISALDIRPSIIHERPVRPASTLAIASPFKPKQESRTPAKDPTRKVLFPDSGYDSTQSDISQIFHPKPPAKPRPESALSRRKVSYVISPIEILKRKVFFDFASAAGLDKKYLKSLIDANSDGLRLSSEFEAFIKDKMPKLYKDCSREVFNGYMTLVGRSIKETDSETLVFALEESDQVTFEMFKDLVLQSSIITRATKSESKSKDLKKTFIFKGKDFLLSVYIPLSDSRSTSFANIRVSAISHSQDHKNNFCSCPVTIAKEIFNDESLALAISMGSFDRALYEFYEDNPETFGALSEDLKSNFSSSINILQPNKSYIVKMVEGKENICTLVNSIIILAYSLYLNDRNEISEEGLEFLRNNLSLIFFRKISATTIESIASESQELIEVCNPIDIRHRVTFLSCFESYTSPILSKDLEEFKYFKGIELTIKILEEYTKNRSNKFYAEANIVLHFLYDIIEKIDSDKKIIFSLPSFKDYESSEAHFKMEMGEFDFLEKIKSNFVVELDSLSTLLDNLKKFMGEIDKTDFVRPNIEGINKTLVKTLDLVTCDRDSKTREILKVLFPEATFNESPDSIPAGINDNLEHLQQNPLPQESLETKSTTKEVAAHREVTAGIANTFLERARPKAQPFIPSSGPITKDIFRSRLVDPRTIHTKKEGKEGGDSLLSMHHQKGPTGSGFSPRPIRSATKLANDEGRDNPRKK